MNNYSLCTLYFIIIAVANQKIRGNIDDRVFEEAVSVQTLFLPPDFGLSSPSHGNGQDNNEEVNPNKADVNTSRRDTVPDQSKEEPQPPPSVTPITPAAFYTPPDPSQVTPKKQKKSDANSNQPSETSTPRTSPRFTKANTEKMNVSEINGADLLGGGDVGLASKADVQSNADSEISEASVPAKGITEDQDGVEPMETDEIKGGEVNKPFKPPGKVAKTKAKKGRGRPKSK